MSSVKTRFARTILLLSFVFAIAGCAVATEESVQEVTPETDFEAPAEVVAAQDVVLRFLRTSANQCVPPEGALWQASPGAAPDGFEVYRFTTGDCLMTVSFPLAPGSETIYHVTIGDQVTGFCWQANVSPSGEVIATGREAEMLPELQNAAAVYCQEQGHVYEVRLDENGQQCGFCEFDDGTSCNAWTFLQGRCGPGSGQ